MPRAVVKKCGQRLAAGRLPSYLPSDGDAVSAGLKSLADLV